MLKRLTLTLAAVAMTASFAVAHDDHTHDDGKPHDHAAEDAHGHDHAAKHGGVMVHSGHHHLELVLEDGALRLHVSDEDGKPENIDGAKATATVLSGGKTETVTLAPTGESILEGSGSFAAEKGATVVVNLTLPDHETEQARFRFD